MKKALFEGLKRLIEIKSVQGAPEEGKPFGSKVYDCLSEALRQASELGFEVKDADGYYGLAEVGEGELFGILGHLDVVPTGSGWEFEPYKLTEHDGKYFGRGVVDDKGPILMCLYAVAELINEGHKPKKRIRIIFGCNEESGMKCIERYKASEIEPALAISPDADFPVVVSEKGIADVKVLLDRPSGLVDIKGGTRRNVVADSAVAVINKSAVKDITLADGCEIRDLKDSYEISARGKAAHGSTPQLGENAIVKLLYNLGACTGNKLYSELADKFLTDGSGIDMKVSDISGDFTVNLGKIEIRGDKLELSVDMRYPISVKEEEVFAAADRIGKDNTVSLSRPLSVDENSEFVKRLLDVYEEVTGKREKPLRIGGGTYARALSCPAVAFGPTFLGEQTNIHDANECISVDSFYKAYEIYKRAIFRLCF